MKARALVTAACAAIIFTVGCDQAPDKISAAFPRESLSTTISDSEWGSRGRLLETSHYQIYTTCNGARIDIALPGYMEAAFSVYCTLTGAAPQPMKMPMYMLLDRAQWAAMTRSLFGSRGPDGVLENGGYTFRGVTVCWNIGGLATFSVASHEGMHQFLYYNFRSRLPLWAEEGLATQCEGFIMGNTYVRFTPDENMMRLADLRKAMHAGGWLPIRQLLVATSRKRMGQGESFGLGYYGQLYVLVRMLRTSEKYAPKWEKFLADARTGEMKNVLNADASKMPLTFYYQAVAVEAFTHYIASDLTEFEKEFRAYAEKLSHYIPKARD